MDAGENVRHHGERGKPERLVKTKKILKEFMFLFDIWCKMR